MDAATQVILTDLLTTSLIALGIGFVVFAVLRASNPLARWGSSGNVYTSPYHPADLILAALLFALFYLSVTASAPLDPGTDPPPMDLGRVMSGIIQQIGLLFFIVLYLGVFRRIDLTELFGLRQLRPLKLIGVSVAAIVATTILVLFANYLYVEHLLAGRWEAMGKQQVVEIFLESDSIALRVAVAFAAVVVAPVVEEGIFRGFLYGVLKKYSERIFAAVVTSLVFASIHMNIPALLPLGILALCLCLAYELSGSLLVPILMHAMFNGFMLVGMLVTGGEG